MRPISPGDRIGPYQVASRLGAGGMGEVWRARDTRLNRDVAIKVCAERFADRFEREAHAIAALNHPNVCTLFDVGPDYLVMELVDGPTLADRLRQGPIPFNEAVGIARQITAALDAAHAQGIVHRDLKPANIKIRPDGSVKVLDFGLAKTGVTTIESSDDARTATAATRVGQVVGTPAYMAPEQARGNPIDRRADIWSFGAILCEMVTGERVFKGEDTIQTLAAVTLAPPDLTRVPPQLRRLVESCLEKDPTARLRDIGDAWKLVEDGAPRVPVQRIQRRASWTVAAALAVAALAAAAAASAFYYGRNVPGVDDEIIRFTIPLPPTVLEFDDFAISPDGKHLVLNGTGSDGIGEIWVRSLDNVAAAPLPGTGSGREGFWSPDSGSIGFFSQNKLVRVDLGGGAPIELADAPDARGGTWSERGAIVFAPGQTGPLFQVPAEGGDASPVTRLEEGEIAHRYPRFLPGGTRFLYAAVKAGAGRVSVQVGSIDSSERQVLLEAASAAAFADGYLLYNDNGGLMARGFDPSRLAFTGPARLVAAAIGTTVGNTNNLGGRPAFSVSSAGLLAYHGRQPGQVVWRDRSGKVLEVVGDADGRPELSPDGTQAAVVVTQGSNRDIVIYDLKRRLPNRFTTDPASDDDGIWSPDGKNILYESNRAGVFDLYMKPTAGGNEQLVYADPLSKYATSLSPDGKYLAYWSIGDPKTNADIWVLPDPLIVPRRSEPIPFRRTEFRELFPQFSPDGNWIAFYSNDTGRQEIYIAPFPGREPKVRVSSSGGVVPRWSRDGKELFYVALDGKLMVTAVRVENGAVHVGATTPLFGTLPTTSGYPYDVSPDGQRFLTVVPADPRQIAEITIVRNWAAAVR